MKKYLRNVYVLAHEPSIELVEKNIEHMIHKNVDWASFDDFGTLEDKILSKVNKTFDVVSCFNEEYFLQERERIESHPVFITNHEIVCKHDVKKALVSSLGYGLGSLFAMLICLMKIGYPRIYIFGADGKESTKETVFLNNHFWALAKYWNVPRQEIYNVGLDSKIQCFKKISFFDLV
jgi:hypothetical protein